MDVVLRELARHDPAANRALDAIDELARLHGVPEDLAVAVRLIARFSGYPARIVDRRSGVVLRADPSGAMAPSDSPAHRDWHSAAILAGEDPVLWIEHTGSVNVIEAALLDRAADLMRRARLDDSSPHPPLESQLMDRIHRGAPIPEALLETFGLRPETRCRAVAMAGPTLQIAVSGSGRPGTRQRPQRWVADTIRRTGVGIPVRARDLAESWRTAVLALAFAADGTEKDPGLPVMRFEDLGILADLAPAIIDRGAVSDDVQSIDRAAASVPWGLATLDALARHGSLRLASEALFAHHSTVQSRAAVLQRRLGWDIQTTAGKQRLHLALTARRLLLHPPHSSRPVGGTPLVRETDSA